MKTHQEKALDYFRKGYNCAQSVLLPFAGNNKLPTQISAGFGGGMGRMQKTCGALTGAFMALGLKYGAPGCPDEESKQRLYTMIRDLNSDFIKINGSDQCSDLLKEDLNSEKGKQHIIIKNLHTVVCEKCIVSAVELVEKIHMKQ